MRDGVRRGARVLLPCYLAVLLFALLAPSARTPSASVGWLGRALERLGAPEQLLEPSRVEFLANVAILVPAVVLGAVVWAAPSWRDWTAYGFVFSGGVEVVQALLLEERSATYVDVVANTLGALVGGLLVAVVRRRPGAVSH
ncbi:VanZ family protein [Nocardioides sp. cx-169]|uniref:VanZ family protein n=1 Tax=Nocardioides sp. cx-169 TaxID=2899080 RepID=UPI001E39392C|nr:VanZ family protein [Nocardioides sp. cx-169]MCD4533732.1 VanZ family protein [Nocardioides sp. cx-169]